MAEQKIDDTNPPAARRAARPFIGPAGGASAARPLLRPPASGGRANPAPFAPPLAPPRAALGIAPSAPPSAPAPSAPAAATPAAATPAAATPAEPPAAGANVEPLLPSLVAESAPALDASIVPPRPTPPVASLDLTVAASVSPTPVEEETVDYSTAVGEAGPDAGTPFSVGETDLAFGGPMPDPDTAPSDVVAMDLASTEPPMRRPTTSEMLAIDAFDAFDSVWGPSNTPKATPVIDAPTATVDAESLGSGLDASHPWTEEILAATDAVVEQPIDYTSVDYTSVDHANVDHTNASAGPDTVDTAWTRELTPESAMPAWLADDTEIAPPVEDAPAIDLMAPPEAPTAAVASAIEEPPAAVETGAPRAAAAPEVPSSEQWPDPLLAEYAPYISMPDGGEPTAVDAPMAAVPSMTVDSPMVVDSPMEIDATLIDAPLAIETAAVDATSATEPTETHRQRVSAALDRLAERVRAGEIDVSFVAPEAPDAAVLASVLAALLGGSSSR